MNTTSTRIVETSSEPAIELVAHVVRRPRKRSAAAQIAARNAEMDADSARLLKLAAANTRRLSGKPSL